MKSNLLLVSLFSAVAMSACGGGGSDSAAPALPASSSTSAPSPVASTPAAAPAATPGGATFDAQCPDGARRISLINSTISGANTAVTNDNVTLRTRFPVSAATLTVCPLSSVTAGFPAAPAALTALLTGTPVAAVVATGDFALLTEKQLAITFDFGSLGADAIAAKKIVAYTINASGAWTRTPLVTTFAAGSTASSRVVSAAIDQVGFYTIE